jgi:hypothetical protein
MDPEKRRDFVQKVNRHVIALQQFLSSSLESQVDSLHLTPSTETIPCFPSSQLPSITSAVASEGCQEVSAEKEDIVKILFNASHERIQTNFQFQLKQQSQPPPSEDDLGEKKIYWREVELDSVDSPSSPQDPQRSFQELYENYGVVAPLMKSLLSSDKEKIIGEYCLTSYHPVDATLPVHLPDRDLIPLVEESDEILAFIRHDLFHLQQLVQITSQAIQFSQLLPNFQKIYSKIEEKSLKDLEAQKTITSYERQRIWGYISRGLYRGVRDQSPDFNQATLASLPASWTIRVEGRPELSTHDDTSNEVIQTDTVCMCCFDGITSEDCNKIIFCDGCNSSLHQMCYGIHEVPEGDYYCQRCVYIQNLLLSGEQSASDQELVDQYEPQEIKELVVCCFCQIPHGGLKPTTDGRWVHMCCVFWSNNSCVIKNLEEMAPIDISGVALQVQPGTSSRYSSSSRNKSQYRRVEDDSEEDTLAVATVTTPTIGDSRVCLICNQKLGYITHCSHDSANTSSSFCPCHRSFHPICAWFAGYYVETSVTDPTHLATHRDGQYPDGIHFKFYCLPHTPPPPAPAPPLNGGEGLTHPHQHQPSSALARQIEQQSIRQKYRIDESDLSTIPGKIVKKRRNRKKSVAGASSSTERLSSTGVSKVKELNIDIYPENICAICLSPTHRMLQSHPHEDPETLLTMPTTEICSCSLCHITIHRSCLNSPSSASIPPTPLLGGIWKCERCSFLDSVKIEKEPKTTLASPSSVGVGVAEEVQELTSLGDKEIPFEEIKCHLCPRRGGAFMQRSHDQKWVHYYCERHRPTTRASTAATAAITTIGPDGTILKEKKQNCIYCNRKTGILVRCCELHTRCSTSFHPLCAARSGEVFLRLVRSAGQTTKEQYCKHHIPETVYRLPNGYWVDLLEISNLRKSLDSARLILDLIKSREKIKKRLYLQEQHTLQHKIHSAMKKLKKKILGDLFEEEEEGEGEEVEGSESEEGGLGDEEEGQGIIGDERVNGENGFEHIEEEEQEEEEGLETDSRDESFAIPTQQIKRRGRPPKLKSSMTSGTGAVRTKNLIGEDGLEILPTKRQSKLRTGNHDPAAAPPDPTAAVPKKWKSNDPPPPQPLETLPLGGVDLSGQEVTADLVLKSNRSVEEYHKYMREELRKTVDETRSTIGIFGSQRSFIEFEKQLKLSVTLLEQKTLLEVTKEYGGTSEDLKYARQQQKRSKQQHSRRAATAVAVADGDGVPLPPTHDGEDTSDRKESDVEEVMNRSSSSSSSQKKKRKHSATVVPVAEESTTGTDMEVIPSIADEPKPKKGRGKKSESTLKDDSIPSSPPPPPPTTAPAPVTESKPTPPLPLTHFDEAENLFYQTFHKKIQRKKITKYDSFALKMIPFYSPSSSFARDDTSTTTTTTTLCWPDYQLASQVGSVPQEQEQYLIQLECKLFHLLQILRDCVVPITGPLVEVTDPESFGRCVDRMKQALTMGKILSLPNWWVDGESESEIETRCLMSDFEEIGEGTINRMKQRLQCHQYRSLASFAKDFYEILNHARLSTKIPKVLLSSSLFSSLSFSVCLSLLGSLGYLCSWRTLCLSS